ncbi:nucleoside recognition domain-containing protein [Mucilaginibacter sp. L3T2-6]|uniref:nucleoside recognition domain-containing protein n=1 Tax=Mucilaginibacter sp. L3T2-6 TaxID=3062491 RepID=UPI002676B64A|nr:spore maturation protein [Mucilaginibacter sp. L3T2-6]MDO3644109.1 nucleoside recognition domain-containing protein [Mucilaginibacter sp. L3T2-6]MDV6216610.1 nucleoside recognition domain-containing protein [Mucilaginibacter sp. L3T2-6]
MALNYIWIAFFLIAFVVALIRLIFFGDTEIFMHLVSGMFDSSKASVMDIALPLAGNMALWLGIMNIGEKAGAINFLSRIVGPFFNRLFPEVPKNHPATGQVLMSFSANLLGLDNAATPLGLKAIDSLQDLNKDKDTASNAQIMYLVLLTSGLQLLPVSIIAQRSILHAKDPTDIFIPCIIATFVAAVSGMLFVALKQKINLFDRVIIGWIGGIACFIVLLVWFFTNYLTKEQIGLVSKVASNLMLFLIPVIFISGALYKKVNVFEAFIDGAKRGFETSVKIIPYLVAMLVGIAVFRACGALGYMNDGLRWLITQTGLDTRFVDAMPVAYMKPLSGSGSKAMMINVMTTYGPDSFSGRLGSVFNGSADTTFYIVALYFGSVGIKKSRYAIPAGLFADLAGIIAAIFVSYLFFG